MNSYNDLNEDDFYEVENIIALKRICGNNFYLVKWLSYPIYQSTWEPESNLKDVYGLIKEFKRKHPKKTDKKLYSSYVNELKNHKINMKNNSQILKEFLNKKRLRQSEKTTYSKSNNSEENDENYLDLLKKHCYINLYKAIDSSS